jgi:hypothetical protein
MEPSFSLTPPAASILSAAAWSAARLLIPNDLTGPVNVPNAAILVARRCGFTSSAADAKPSAHAAKTPRAIILAQLFCVVPICILKTAAHRSTEYWRNTDDESPVIASASAEESRNDTNESSA